MKRDELLQSSEYWTTKIQLDLFNQMEIYMQENSLNRTQLAEKLGVTKSYISQVLNGDFDHRISKLVELSMAIGVVPQINFETIDQYIKKDENRFVTSFLNKNDYQNVYLKEDYNQIKSENYNHPDLIAA